MSHYLTFRKYNDEAEARAVADLLADAGIPVSLEITPPALLSPVITGLNSEPEVLVKLPPLYFNQARELLLSRRPVHLEDVTPDHPLFAMTDTELREILARPDEWGLENFQLARLILEQRGSVPEAAEIAALQQEHIRTLAVAETADAWWIVPAYIIALLWLVLEVLFIIQENLVVWFALPLLSPILLGAYLVQAKKTLPNGQRVRTFTGGSRRHGRILLLLGIVALILFCYQVFIAGSFPLIETSHRF